ncbi:MAG: Ig-like domain-containing protein [Cyanobacteria bacterium P01_F01_bin.150]
MASNNDQVFPVSGPNVISREFIADDLGFDIVQNISQFSLTFATGTIFDGIEAIDGNNQDIFVDTNDTVDFSSIREMRNVRYLRGKNGREIINGSLDDDTFRSSRGRDMLYGKAGDDTFLVEAKQSLNDTFNGGSGDDVIRNISSSPLTFKKARFIGIEEIDGNNKPIRVERDGVVDFSSVQKMTNVRYIIGRNRSQTIVASQDNDIIYSSGGVDLLDGQGGADVFYLSGKQAISDTIQGGPGNDKIKNRSNKALVFKDPIIQGIEEIDGNGKNILVSANGVVDFSSVNTMTDVRSIRGSKGNEIIIGSQANDSIQGRGGDDVMEGYGGSDTIDGGTGEDIAVFSGNRQDYRIKKISNDTFTVKDLRNGSPHGTDTLYNIEYLEFADAKVDLSLPLNAGIELVAVDDAATIVNGTVTINNGLGAKGTNNGTNNVLGNDTAPDGAMSVFTVNGLEANVGQSVPGSFGGLFTLQADGRLSFSENGDFANLQEGQTATTDINYALKDSNQQFTQQKNNIVFVVDVSGSTRSGFQGTAVGDTNGDGRSNTILDAEIAAFRALDDKIAALNLPASQVNIGLVSFATTGKTIGSYDPGTQALDNALGNLRAGGLTNFESPLQKTQSWFASQGATQSDNNVVYFLSDGFKNRGGEWQDEISSMVSNYNASFVAIGVGQGASLSQLATIDNTNGAEIVTSSDALTSSLLSGVKIDDFKTSNTATVSVTVQGTNGTPTANDDVATTKVNQTIDIDVLRNDSGINIGDVISIANVGGATSGVTEIIDNKVRYTPSSGFIGQDSLTYTMRNSQGKTASASVSIEVRPTNTAPVATNDAASTPINTAISVNVLANDSDIDGDSLILSSPADFALTPSNGTATVINNRIYYTPSTGYVGTDTFNYQVLDGVGGSAIGQLAVTVEPGGGNASS